ncbi:MAG: cobyrinate a,c-diamide synthase [Desulfosoma sp.]
MSVRKWGFVIAAPHSGSGKTTVTLAILAALRKRGVAVQPFKVGPDFIDPGLHTRVTGRASRNLDGWMLSRETNRALFSRALAEADAAVVEGVMGLFDGYDGISEAGSTAEMAKWLGLPVVLVVDARSMARSVAALVHGFCYFDPELRCAGVIFNRVGSDAHLDFLKEAMTASHPNLPVLGGFPRDDGVRLPERHLGLVTAEESPLDEAFVESLARAAETHLDLDALPAATALVLPMDEAASVQCTGAPGGTPRDSSTVQEGGSGPVIAVARDAAFCFYYEDNLDLLKTYGARLIFFSPLAGETLPKDAGALYLGGGYPEVHAQALRRNERFFSDLRAFAAAGRPVYAECGGLMVLSRAIQLLSGDIVPMAGILPFATRMLPKRKALGYVEVLLSRPCLLGDAGTRLRGHEFHYSEIVGDPAPDSLSLCYRLTARKYRPEQDEGYQVGSVLASYVHLHWGSAPHAAARFVDAARKARGK